MTRREVIRLAALAPAAGLLVAGCRPSESNQSPDEPLMEVLDDGATAGPVTLAELQELLDRRAEAQRQGDEDAYLADLDPDNAKLIQREQLVFGNVRQFEPDDVRFVLGEGVSSQLAYEATLAKDKVRIAGIIKVIRLATDAGPEGVLGPGEVFEYELTRRDGGIVVTDIVPLTRNALTKGEQGASLVGLEALPANAPWNSDVLTVVRVGNVWLAADDSVDDLDPIAAVAEAEASGVEQMWGDRARFPGYVFFLTRRKKAVLRWFDFGLSGLSGFREGFKTDVFGVRANGASYTGQAAGARMVVYLPGTEELGWSTSRTIRHELVHAVTARAEGTGDGDVWLIGPASWAVEGFATYIETRGDAGLEQQDRALAADGFDGTLPNTKGFQKGSATRISTNYALGSTVFSFVEQVHSFETAIDFFEEVVDYGDNLFNSGEAFVDTPAFDGICQRILDMDRDEFFEQWAAYVRGA
jgi:hypothetical protein